MTTTETSLTTTAATAAQSPLETLENCVRENPTRTLLMVAGLGVAAAFLARSLAPTPQNRALQVLEDIQDRLSDLADEGALAMSRGVRHVGELHLDRTFDKLSRGIKGLFH
ncbi:hypothetical protein EI77_02579 [Prosthecobacter fusiformis]|uniref:Uncharacterized protein n=1 Tax=Prosthecobacter fusiformis TaxID=48464 RepID=A0A4V3FFN1_9BACT|nr:hypothetical protein [Prosthecobacter fusiformis]TDU71453.1 hypothetical protein EI77_02579 [Prosthecobacter fusiformis]